MGSDFGNPRPSPGAIRTLAFALGFGTLVLAGIVYAWVARDISVGDLTRDAADSTHGPTYLAAVSNLGFVLWGSSAAVSLLAAGVLRANRANAELVRFLMAGGLLSLMLLADDMWLLHDRVFPNNIGIPELIVYIAYATATLGYLYVFRAQILRTDYSVLLVAGALLACSLVIDFVTNDAAASNQKYITEDAPKFLGMVTWLAYHGRTAYMALTDRTTTSPEGRAHAVSVL